MLTPGEATRASGCICVSRVIDLPGRSASRHPEATHHGLAGVSLQADDLSDAGAVEAKGAPQPRPGLAPNHTRTRSRATGSGSHHRPRSGTSSPVGDARPRRIVLLADSLHDELISLVLVLGIGRDPYEIEALQRLLTEKVRSSSHPSASLDDCRVRPRGRADDPSPRFGRCGRRSR